MSPDRNERLRAQLLALGLGTLAGCQGSDRAGSFDPKELFQTGDLAKLGSLGTEGWRSYRSAPALHRAWAPSLDSKWRPFYRPTLSASIAIAGDAAQPVHVEGAAAELRAEEFAAVRPKQKLAVFVDLAGEHSVAFAARLARRGFDPIVTINNWPHPRGVVRLERALGALLYFAEEIHGLRRDGKIAVNAEPVFVLESSRIQKKDPDLDVPSFDNRYFHIPADFPAPSTLRESGITGVVLVQAAGRQNPCEDDLLEYFEDLSKSGIALFRTEAGEAPLAIEPWTIQKRETMFQAVHTVPYTSHYPFYGRPYSPYYHFWHASRNTWGDPSSGGGYGGSSRSGGTPSKSSGSSSWRGGGYS